MAEHNVHGASDQSKSQSEQLYRKGIEQLRNKQVEQGLIAFTKAIKLAETPAEKALYNAIDG